MPCIRHIHHTNRDTTHIYLFFCQPNEQFSLLGCKLLFSPTTTTKTINWRGEFAHLFHFIVLVLFGCSVYIHSYTYHCSMCSVACLRSRLFVNGTYRKKNKIDTHCAFDIIHVLSKSHNLLLVLWGRPKWIAIVFALLILNLFAVKVFLINLGDEPSYSPIHIIHIRCLSVGCKFDLASFSNRQHTPTRTPSRNKSKSSIFGFVLCFIKRCNISSGLLWKLA